MRVSAVPIPAAVWLFGSGLMGFLAMRRRAKSQ
ncbi:VPLPA-CTERM sorting domain-containing protein [Methylophaga sp. UBA3191]